MEKTKKELRRSIALTQDMEEASGFLGLLKKSWRKNPIFPERTSIVLKMPANL